MDVELVDTCRVCGQPIRWGQLPGDRWIALEHRSTRGGNYAYLPWKRRLCVLRLPLTLESFEVLPVVDRARLAKGGTRELWRRTLNGPRYRPHSRVCASLQMMSVQQVLSEVMNDILSRSAEPFGKYSQPDDVPYFD